MRLTTAIRDRYNGTQMAAINIIYGMYRGDYSHSIVDGGFDEMS